MTRIFKTKNFARWAKKERITNSMLKDSADEIIAGKIDADLGGGLMKKRIARPGKGKRSGYRTLLACNLGNRAIYIFGFAKNNRDNIDEDERKIYKDLAHYYLTINDKILTNLLNEKELLEI